MPTEWQNARGRSKWQPTLASGLRLYVVPLWDEAEEWWLYPESDARKSAYLCSTYRSAERIERREQKRRDRNECDKTYREVRRA